MKIELSKYTVNLIEKITWKEILGYMKILGDSYREEYDMILYITDYLISDLEFSNKIITDKRKILEVILEPNETTLEDLMLILDTVAFEIKKKSR